MTDSHPENVSFDSYSNAYHNFSSGGGSWQYCRDGDLPDNQLRIVERWTSSAVLPFFRGIHVVFEDLEFLDPQSGKWSTLAEGTWELRFTAQATGIPPFQFPQKTSTFLAQNFRFTRSFSPRLASIWI